MGYTDEAFANLKTTLNITPTENQLAQRRHENIRSHVASHWALEDHFLTGSYRRDTKTKKLRDVDIFVVVDKDGDQGDLRSKSPSVVLQQLKTVLDERYDTVTADEVACVIDFGQDDDIMSIEVVPAFKRKGGGYEIPHAGSGWIATNPKRHHELSTAKNKECNEKYVPFVKMVKGINRELGEPVKPSFLIEVMSLDIVRPPFGRYQDEVRFFLADAAEKLDQSWPDPAGVGPDVNTMSSADRTRAASALEDALEVAERAVWLEDDGQERAAVEEWRRLFGWRMPRPR